MCIHRVDTLRLIAVNPAMVWFYGYSEAELLAMTLGDLWPSAQEAHSAPFNPNRVPQPAQPAVTHRHSRKDGVLVDVEITADDVGFLGLPAHMLVIVDITLRLQAEREWARLGRAQQMLSSCNEVLIRATAQDALLQSICRIAVEIGGYFGAWVGFARDDEAKSIDRVAFAGVTPSYALLQRISWSDTVPEGRGAAGRTVRSGKPEIVSDIHLLDKPLTWGPAMQAAGIRGLISLPLSDAERTFGVLFLYANQPIQASQDELELLQELANDLAFGIGHLQAQHEAERDVQTRSEILAIQQEIALLDGDLYQVMTLMAERARTLTGADGCAFDMVEGDDLVCRARSVTAAGENMMLLGSRLLQGKSLAGLAVQTNSTMVSEDTLADPRVDQHTSPPQGVRSAIITPMYVNGTVIGVLKAAWARPRGFAARDVANLQILVQTLGSTIQRHRMGDQLRLSESQYRMLFTHNPQPMWVAENLSLRLLAVNQATVEHYGYSEQELLGMSIRDLWVDDIPQSEAFVQRHMLDKSPYKGARRHRKKNGDVMDLEITSNPIEFNGAAARLVLAVDVTLRLRAELELARVNRARQMLSACNEALIHAASQDEFLSQVCQLTIDIGGYKGAWVGFARDDAAKSIDCMATAGLILGHSYPGKLSWSEDTPNGRGPVGRSLRSGEVVIVHNLDAEEPARQARRAEMQALGLGTLVCLPLRNARRTFGVMYLVASRVLQSSQDEVILLQELANDLAFGIENLRAREEQRRVQAAVLKVAAAVSASSGLEFFAQLARNMAEALGAQAAFVTRVLPGEPATGRTLAAVLDGEMLANFDYPIHGTPCEALSEHSHWTVLANVADSYLLAPLLAQMQVQAYFGQRLDDAKGSPVGHIFVLFRAPQEDSDFVLSTLQIFAARVAAEMQRQKSDARIREQAALLDKAQDAIILRHLDEGIVYWNQGAERLYGWTAQETRGQLMADRLNADWSMFSDSMRKLMETGSWKGEVEHRRKDGSSVAVESHCTLVHDDQGQPQSVLSINIDITPRKAAERAIQQLAFHDQLTQLPNRLLLMDRLQQALAGSARRGNCGALLFIDLDNFKTLNDTLGHESGDLLLQQVAMRLTACVRQTDTVARFGGDEFAVMLADLSHTDAEAAIIARSMGEKILAALAVPYQISGNQHRTTSSIGVAPFGHHHKGASELLKQADLAMYQAKTAGRNAIRFFDPSMQAIVNARAQLEFEMRLALTQQEYVLHYQPQIDATGRVTGVEALVRWRHPLRGAISPAEFIPLAEETGFIIPLGQWVLASACQQLKTWQASSDTAHLTMAVNVSARQFRSPDFVEQVTQVLRNTEVDGYKLKLELTESLLVDDLDQTIIKMTALKALGLGFSLDDFGTGYSSLSYLKRLPLDQLKIDQSFVRDIVTDVNDAAIVRTVIALGQSLGLAVIAEGVETAEQRHFLAAHGCVAYQGYFFSRPLAIADLHSFLQLAPATAET